MYFTRKTRHTLTVILAVFALCIVSITAYAETIPLRDTPYTAHRQAVPAAYATIAGVIRNAGEGWHIIDDKGHKPLNITAISVVNGDNKNGYVRIDYGFQGSKVITLTVTPDETYAQQGVIAGASVARDHARIKFGRNGKPVAPNKLQSRWGNFWIYGMIANEQPP